MQEMPVRRRRRKGDEGAVGFIPMNQHPTPTRQPLADESITPGKVLQDILVLDVVDLDHEMVVRGKQIRI